jgi:hypothetical protein
VLCSVAFSLRNSNAGLPRDGPAAVAEDGNSQMPAISADLKAALDGLKRLRAGLVRECNMGYRCQARLRDKAQSLASAIASPPPAKNVESPRS